MASPSLYGISNSNRNFSDKYFWGKNQFNSSFPIALANYMRDNEKKAILLSLNGDLKIDKLHQSFDTIYNTKLSNSELYFSFESRYEPFSKYIHDELNPIDLVIKSKDNLDIFVWTDFSISRLFMDSAIKNTNFSGISRHQRTAVRLSRFLYEVSKNNMVYQQPIYDGMNYDNKNDKEFAVSGAKTVHQDSPLFDNG